MTKWKRQRQLPTSCGLTFRRSFLNSIYSCSSSRYVCFKYETNAEILTKIKLRYWRAWGCTFSTFFTLLNWYKTWLVFSLKAVGHCILQPNRNVVPRGGAVLRFCPESFSVAVHFDRSALCRPIGQSSGEKISLTFSKIKISSLCQGIVQVWFRSAFWPKKSNFS